MKPGTERILLERLAGYRDGKVFFIQVEEAFVLVLQEAHEDAIEDDMRRTIAINDEKVRKARRDSKPITEKSDELIAHVVKLVNAEMANLVGDRAPVLDPTSPFQAISKKGRGSRYRIEIKTAHTWGAGVSGKKFDQREPARVVVQHESGTAEERGTFKVRDDGTFNVQGIALRILWNLDLLTKPGAETEP